ncbi:MAG: hypothetical protein ACHQUC_06660 [Chlamydiales bacterium]
MSDSLGPITGFPKGEHASFDEKFLNPAGNWDKLTKDEKVIYAVAASMIGVLTLGVTHGLYGLYHVLKHVYRPGGARQKTTEKTRDVSASTPSFADASKKSLPSPPLMLSSPLTSLASSPPRLSPLELVQKEIGEKLHNYNIQTKIEIAVLKAYGHKNPKLSPEEKRLLKSYTSKLEEISRFDEKMLEELNRVHGQGGGSQEILNVYLSFWGAESSEYSTYAKNVGDVATLMPRLNALLLDKEKLPVGRDKNKAPFASFEGFVSSLARHSKIKGLLNRLIMQEKVVPGTLLRVEQLPEIDSTIKYPAEKISGAIYAQWMMRVKDLLGAAKKAIEKASEDTGVISAAFENAKDNVAMINEVLIMSTRSAR